MTEVLGQKELRSQVDSILKGREANVIALRSRAGWSGGALVCDDGKTFEVCQVRSVLEFHERVLDAEERQVPLVCLTELQQGDLCADLVARLFRRRLHSVDPWTAVRGRFQAQEVEAALVPQTHLARTLVEVEPPTGYAKVRGRVLTAEKAWSCLFTYALGMPGDYLDAIGLLQWSIGDTSLYSNAREELKASVRQRVYQVCGPLGRAILACVDGGKASPLSLGLALRAVCGQEGDLSSAQEKAAVRVEPYIGDHVLDPGLAREWARSAEHVAEREPNHSALLAAQELLTQLQLASFAKLSDFLPLGLEQRLESLGEAVTAALENSKKFSLVEQHVLECLRHRSLSQEQTERLEMLPRLLRWLHEASDAPSDNLGELALRYARRTAFADWARLRAEGSQSELSLGQPFRELGHRVVERLEAESERFALTLRAWNQAGGAMKDSGVMGVEHVLDRVVVPLISGVGSRVLLIVLDGCGWPTLHELLHSVSPDWTLRQPEEGALPMVLATFPSVTEYSRTSLLSGKLQAGSAATETQAFRDHPALKNACSDGYPPVVFHKADLEGEAGGLSDTVASKIAQTKSKVVAVVLNAIDDHLDRDDQILHRWRVDTVKYLVSLLNLALSSDRTVVFASDHGHILERGSELHKGDSGGARWQTGRSPQQGEISLSGPRVLCEGGSVIMPWSERLRYTMKKNGYHGGAHPREVLAPLAVLARTNSILCGWLEVRHDIPWWWHGGAKSKAAPQLNYKPKVTMGQLALFEEAAPESDLPKRILEFPLIAQQWKVHKSPPPQDWALALLKLLEGNGRTGTIAELSRSMNLPEAVFRHRFAQVGPLLTVDGIPIVGLATDAETVFLNPKLIEDLPPPPNAKKARGSVVEIERDGELRTIDLPLPTLAPLERQILEELGRHGNLTESQLKKKTGTKRVSGSVEKLMERLHKAGFPHLTQAGDGPEGRIYVLKPEAFL